MSLGKAVKGTHIEELHKINKEIADEIYQQTAAHRYQTMEKKLLSIRGWQRKFLDTRLLREQVVEGVATKDGHGDEETEGHPLAHSVAWDDGSRQFTASREAKCPYTLYDE